MKHREVNPGTIVVSPWYNLAEAAAHLGISESAFKEKAAAGGLPNHGCTRIRRYHVEEVDRWMNNNFIYPGTETVEAGRTRTRRIRSFPSGEGLMNPKTGEIYRSVQP